MPVRQPLVHADIADKARWLQQAPCITCHVILPAENPPYPVSFPIPVRPFTKQNQLTVKRLTEATRQAIAVRSSRRQPIDAWKDVAICASVVAVQAKAAKVIDVDNAAKAIMDTMKGIIFPDDKQVRHLSVHRIRNPDSNAYYLVSLRPVYPELDDVIDLTCQVKFNGLVDPIDSSTLLTGMS